MSFLKGSVTCQRFRLAGPKPRLFGDEHLDRLRALGIGSQKLASADGSQVGWAAGRHVLDSAFSDQANVYPDHLVWDFWGEKNAIPADRMKAEYEIELAALSKDNPSGFPTSKQKREARAYAVEKLTGEARDGRWKKWKCVPVAWDAGRNELWFGATSPSAAARFAHLFEETFCGDLTQGALAGKPQAVTAGTLALALNPAAKNERLSPFVKGVTPEEAAWCPMPEVQPDFLGNEFLVWLWFQGDSEADTITTPDGAEVTFMFSGGVKLVCPRGETGDDTINHASGVRTPEARAALKVGKLPRKAAFTLVRHDDQFSFKLDAETLAVSGAKLPAPDGEVRGRELETTRLGQVRDLAEIVDQLFAAFLERRLSAYWAEDLARIQKWIGRGTGVKA